MFDDRYALIDEETGDPLANTEYALRRESGELEFGTTDSQGHTHLLGYTKLPSPRGMITARMGWV